MVDPTSPTLPQPLPAQPPVPTVQPLSDGAAVALEGQWPDRLTVEVARAELHSYTVANARARALICVGGGYTKLVYDKEGTDVALWLNGLGIEAHVLVHRLPGAEAGSDGVWPRDIALRDALSALDHLQAQTPDLPLLLIGLSSGGHLAGTIALQDHPLVARALGAVIGYAPLNANHRDHKYPEGKADFAPVEKQDFYDDWPVGLSAETLPDMAMFLAYALSDRSVPLSHLLRLLHTAAAEGADVDAHVFGQAPHGFALRDRSGSHAHWIALAQNWIAAKLAAAASE